MDKIFCDIAEKLKATGFFSVIYPYCELIRKRDKTLRPQYRNKAGWVDVQNFDVNGMAYIRKGSKTRIEIDSSIVKTQSCEDKSKLVKMTMPIRIVACIPHDKLPDSLLKDDNLVWDIMAVLQGQMNSTAEDMNLHDVLLVASGYDTDSYSIWESENQGITFDENKLYRFVYVAIDCNIIARGNIDCFKSCLKDAYL